MAQKPVSGDCRINPSNFGNLAQVAQILAGGVAGSLLVLGKWLAIDQNAVIAFLNCLDLNHLYDEHIWNVYVLCGEDIHRFIYHVSMELPDQVTGMHSISGPYMKQVDTDSFMAKRQFGKPGSYWALEHPPEVTDYAYPIV